MRIAVEVVCCTLDECEVAQEAGADRIELCSAIELGGITPSAGLLQSAKRLTSIPIVAMLRPRAGEFVFTPLEIETMLQDSAIFTSLGADGVVLGALHPDGTVASDQLGWVAACRDAGLQTVFHRAFDSTPDPRAAISQIAALGFTRILSSGGARTAADGSELLAELGALGVLEVLPGGGIRSSNAREIAERVGANQIHFAPFRGSGQDRLASGASEIHAVRNVLDSIAGSS